MADEREGRGPGLSLSAVREEDRCFQQLQQTSRSEVSGRGEDLLLFIIFDVSFDANTCQETQSSRSRDKRIKP